uniref:Cyclin N-terminal domain-containing protein n=1 Tax=Steinernema glaseri TaxID=37863 RepID=A0A1I7Y208_9BILA
MATKRPHQLTADEIGTSSRINDENTAENGSRQLKSKAFSGLSLRSHKSHQPKITNVFKASSRKHAPGPAFEVFRDNGEPALKKVTPPPRVPLVDITRASRISNEESLETRTKSKDEPMVDTQDSGVDVHFINDDMEISVGSPHIEDFSWESETEEDSQTFVTAPECQPSKRSDLQVDPCYFGEIFCYLREREEEVRPRYDFMSRQTEITSFMRAILVDWLSDVCTEYNINVASLFLTVSIVDRMLSSFDCPKNKLQLIGAGALFIATKIEEIYPPTLVDLVYTTADCYTKKQILRAEKLILQHLKFDVCAPCRFWFGTFFAKKVEVSDQVDSLMRYFLELSLMSDRFLLYRASELGLAATYLANQWLNPDDDSVDQLLDRVHILKEDIKPIMDDLVDSFKTASTSEHQSIYLKYTVKMHQSVSLLDVPESCANYQK